MGVSYQEIIYARLPTAQIDLLNRLIEGFEHLGIVSTLDREQGRVIIRCTKDTREELLLILNNLPFAIEIE
ncbi:MAG: DUF4911 domain-containing protein [Syntrophomonadaceae bacterium]|nr:DUF4911 domain-containing protein [Syntrophomonadaceae bacterium]